MGEFSDDAKTLMCGLFAFGRGTVKSHPPHSTVTKYRTAFDELLDAKLITVEPFNSFDIWLYKPTDALAAEANRYREWHFSKMFTDPPPPRTP